MSGHAQGIRGLFLGTLVASLGCARGMSTLLDAGQTLDGNGVDVTFLSPDFGVHDATPISPIADSQVEAAADAGCPSPCGLLPQCGCSVTHSCSLTDALTATLCRPNGERGAKFECSNATDCRAGMSCVAGVCAQHCSTHADCAGGRCIGLPRSTLRSLGYCSTPCEVGQAYDTGCPGNVAGGSSTVYCFLQPRASSNSPEYTTCRKETLTNSMTGWAGASCSSHTDCHRGHGCHQGVCRTICVPGSAASQTCSGNATCRMSSQFTIEERTLAFCL